MVRFNDLVWRHDRMICDGVVLRLEHNRSDDWDLGEDCLGFYKTRDLVDQYATFFRQRPWYAPRTVLELGLWDGGSAAFWWLMLRPAKLVGVDAMDREDSAYFRRFREIQGCGDRLKTCWRTQQSDAGALRRIIADNFRDGLDLVIDDASHLYAETRRSFELIFPHLRQGAYYVIEDWSWFHWRDFPHEAQPWSRPPPLSQLALELVEATGTNRADGPRLIDHVAVFRDLLAIERGDLELDVPDGFRLEDHVLRAGNDV
jgi:hypothetical protein